MASEVMAVAPVIAAPPVEAGPPTPPTAESGATASDAVARARLSNTTLRGAIHQAAAVLLSELGVRQQVDTGIQNFDDLLRATLEAVRQQASQAQWQRELEMEAEYVQ